MKTDALDERILEVLGEDARISNRELGRALNVADVTIGKRLLRLQKAGAVRTVALVDPRAVGLSCAAFVRLVTSPHLARQIASNAATLAEASFVALASGRHNVVMLVTVEDRAALARLLHDTFRSWEGVHSLEVLEIVNAVKHRLDVVRIPPPSG
jgi:Lrp/AsnC family transcriptional regulator, regulator for asnA, asnC and gidA